MNMANDALLSADRTTTETIALRDLPGRQPVVVKQGRSIREALEIMDRQKVGAVVVVEGDTHKPTGILTLQDVLRRVARPGISLLQPVEAVMTRQVETLAETATVHEGLLFMSHRKIRHIPVVDTSGRLVQVVSLNQIRDPFAGEVDLILGHIDAAEDVDQLAGLANQANTLGATLLRQHGNSGLLTSVISSLNDALSRRAIELVMARHSLPAVRWCWIVMGSEGRFEQTFQTDQDNGLIFEAGCAREANELRLLFLPFAQEVNQYLDQCGIPHCTGGIMAGRPECCLSLDEWRERFCNWIAAPEPQALLNATIFFDFRPLFGEEGLAKTLRRHLSDTVRDRNLFFRLMAANALEAEPPVGTLRDFITRLDEDKRRTIDLKKYGSRIFVDAGRIFALAAGVAETNTAIRLRAGGASCGLHALDIDSNVQAFAQLQRVRMANQLQVSGITNRNLLNPDSLHRLDRKILREALLQAGNLQLQLRRAYSL